MLKLDALRAALAANGITPASLVPEASGGRAEEATFAQATVLEHDALDWRAVGAPEPLADTVAFLDGVQRTELLGYHGSSPILLASIAAAVRERDDRRLRTVVEERRALVVARRSALEAAAHTLAGLEVAEIPDDQPPHPVRDLRAAQRIVDAARGALELTVGRRYRERSAAWLVVDGSLGEAADWSSDRRAVGISKSHATLPFVGEELERYLRLPHGQRTSIFAPAQRGFHPVRGWALRLWPWEGRDLLYGLIRIEVAPANGTTEIADWISRWLLAERAPVSAPDPRWDRLLYGIRSVEEYLKASR